MGMGAGARVAGSRSDSMCRTGEVLASDTIGTWFVCCPGLGKLRYSGSSSTRSSVRRAVGSPGRASAVGNLAATILTTRKAIPSYQKAVLTAPTCPAAVRLSPCRCLSRSP